MNDNLTSQVQSTSLLGAAPLDWNNAMRTISLNLVAKTPGVGFFVKSLVDIFWRPSSTDIWDEIKQKVIELVDSAVLRKEFETYQHEVDALRISLNRYASERALAEKAAHLAACLESATRLHQCLTRSSNMIHLLPVTITFSYAHLTILRERVLYGRDLYGETDPQRAEELDETINEYKAFFVRAMSAVKTWRRSKISDHQHGSGGIVRDQTRTIRDEVSGDSIVFVSTRSTVDNIYPQMAEAAKRRLFNHWYQEFLKIYLPTFLLDNFRPGHELDLPCVDASMRTYVHGPYWVDEKLNFLNLTSSPIGRIDRVEAWTSDLLSQITVTNSTSSGVSNTVIGKKISGQAPQAANMDGWELTGITSHWGIGVLNGLTLLGQKPTYAPHNPEDSWLDELVTYHPAGSHSGSSELKARTIQPQDLDPNVDWVLVGDRYVSRRSLSVEIDMYKFKPDRTPKHFKHGGVENFRCVAIRGQLGQSSHGHSALSAVEFEFAYYEEEDFKR